MAKLKQTSASHFLSVHIVKLCNQRGMERDWRHSTEIDQVMDSRYYRIRHAARLHMLPTFFWNFRGNVETVHCALCTCVTINCELNVILSTPYYLTPDWCRSSHDMPNFFLGEIGSTVRTLLTPLTPLCARAATLARTTKKQRRHKYETPQTPKMRKIGRRKFKPPQPRSHWFPQRADPCRSPWVHMMKQPPI